MAKDAADIIGFESEDYLLVKQLDQGGGAWWQEAHLDIWVSHLQVPRVAKSIVAEQENLKRKVLFRQVST